GAPKPVDRTPEDAIIAQFRGVGPQVGPPVGGRPGSHALSAAKKSKTITSSASVADRSFQKEPRSNSRLKSHPPRPRPKQLKPKSPLLPHPQSPPRRLRLKLLARSARTPTHRAIAFAPRADTSWVALPRPLPYRPRSRRRRPRAASA